MNQLSDIALYLHKADNFLVISHAKPDGDAAGSALGMGILLRANGKNADVLFSDDIPDKFKKLHSFDYIRSVSDYSRYSTAIVLDCARAIRINDSRPIDEFAGTVINIDHHIDNDVKGDLNFVEHDASACAAICTDLAKILAKDFSWQITSEAATMFYLGIVTDTGAFRFSNTNGNIFRKAADLLEHGADSEAVINAAFFSKKANQQLFEADMILNHIKREFDGRYVYAFVPQSVFDKYGFDMKDGEGVIELLREIDGAVIAVLVYPKDNTLKVSLRSKDARYPVGPVARSLDGGGHEMAAGITARNTTPEKLLEALKDKIGDLLNK